MGLLNRAVGFLGGVLGRFSGIVARVGHGFVGLLAGRQHRVKRVDGRARQTRLHIDPHHLQTNALPRCRERRQLLIDALHQITAQTLTAFRRLFIAAEQLRARH